MFHANRMLFGEWYDGPRDGVLEAAEGNRVYIYKFSHEDNSDGNFDYVYNLYETEFWTLEAFFAVTALPEAGPHGEINADKLFNDEILLRMANAYLKEPDLVDKVTTEAERRRLEK